MKLNKKQKLFIIISSGCLLILGANFLLYYLNKPRNLNVILITIDALRADHLSCYGYKRNTSPNIDRLSRDGVMFTQAISASSSTISSVPSIMTSVYPSTHGVWNFGDTLNPSVITLANILKDNGFYTGMIVAHYFPHFSARKDFITQKIKLDAKADVMTDWAIDWLTKNKNKKFFLWMHYFDPHGPYNPPLPYSEMYPLDKFYQKGIEAPLLNRKTSGFGGIPGYQVKDGIKDVSYYIAQYDGEISFIDNQIGRFRQILEKLRLLDKSIIVITSDHGESLGEHNYYFDHGGSLYDTLIRVPLIIQYNQIPSNNVINTMVSSLDIMPTILDMLRIKIDPQFKIYGISLLPIILGRNSYTNRYIFTEYFEGENPKFAIRNKEWKLIYNKIDNNYELYNLKDDPQELKNLISIEKEQFWLLKQELDKYIKQTRYQNKESKYILDTYTKEKLKSLGYAQ